MLCYVMSELKFRFPFVSPQKHGFGFGFKTDPGLEAGPRIDAGPRIQAGGLIHLYW